MKKSVSCGVISGLVVGMLAVSARSFFEGQSRKAIEQGDYAEWKKSMEGTMMADVISAEDFKRWL